MNSKEKKSIKKPIIICVIFLFLLLIGFMLINSRIFNKKEIVEADFSSVNKICELATLRCYYHDVAEYKKEADGLFQYGLFKYGYKKFWIEYDGIVEVGVNVNQVKVSEPDNNGVVKVFVPKAEVFNVTADKDSMSDPISETGKLTKITTDEKAKAFSEAQKNMRKNAEADETLLSQAHDNAKKLIESYIIETGEAAGVKYKVDWVKD